MEKIANKQKICEVLLEAAQKDKNIVALCSDSRGSLYSVRGEISRAVRRDGYRRAKFGEYRRGPG